MKLPLTTAALAYNGFVNSTQITRTTTIAGPAVAAVAALAFNFFHTQPYHSMRIHSSRDVTIIALRRR